MALSKTDLIVGLVTTIVAFILAVLAEVTLHEITTTVVIAALSVCAGFFADVRIAQHNQARSLPPLLPGYAELSSGKCQLFSKLADDKYAETIGYFQNLQGDYVELPTLGHAYTVLEYVFRSLDDIKYIYATSHGELDEWKEENSWWATNYRNLHLSAKQRGAVVTRIFIFPRGPEPLELTVLSEHRRRHQDIVKVAVSAQVPPSILPHAGNCMVFADARNRPIYGIRAAHEAEGMFVEAALFRDQHRVNELWDAFKRIDAISAELRPDGDASSG